MKRSTWILVFLVVVSFAGIASAETAAPPAEQAAVSADTAVTSPAEMAPTIDLAQIFGSPGGMSSMPAPMPRACTMFQCKLPCQQPGCLAVCVDIQACRCETICQLGG